MKILPFTKHYSGRLVLDFPGIELERGKIYAVIGANGSGKSTFAKILSGSVPADKKARHCDALSIGYMPQKNFAFRMSTKKNILLALKDEDRANKLMAALGLEHLAQKPAHRLSGGETARMALARLMMKSYELVILDEPTAAMDMETTSLSEELIVNYVRESGCALLLITHSLQQAKRIADETLYFHKGSLMEHGPSDKLLSSPQKPETKQFLEFYGI